MHIEGAVDNTEGTVDVDKVLVELNQNTFVSSNAGIFRTYRSSAAQFSVPVNAPKGKEGKFSYDFKVPVVEHQTAVGTLVANHYRIEVSTQAGPVSSDNPCIYSPLFVLKQEFNLKSVSRPR